MEYSDLEKERMIQNLRDAACDEEMIENYLKAVASKDKRKATGLLENHRKNLLALFHRYSDCIDCLDYLMNKIERNEENKE